MKIDRPTISRIDTESGILVISGIAQYESSISFSNDTDIVDKKYVDDKIENFTSDHEKLEGLLGGDTNNHWHLTSDQHNELTSGQSTILHTHTNFDQEVEFNNIVNFNNSETPFTVLSSGVVTNLNAHYVDGYSQNVFSLIDGTRNFTGVVQYNSHKTFVNDTDIVDKKYVDDSIVITSGSINADTLDGYHAGNISGAIPINNDIINNSLNADMVDGCHVSSTPEQNTIPIPISGSLLSSGWLPNTIRGYENPIDTVAYCDTYTQDYELQVGEVAKITFSSTQTVLLRIKVTGTLYKMYLIPGINLTTSGGTSNKSYLFPNNNTSYDKSKFYSAAHQVLSGAHGYTWGAEGTTAGFRIGECWNYSEYLICTRKESKMVNFASNILGTNTQTPSAYTCNCAWRDTTTEWTSLGTIWFPQDYSGTIYVQRLA